MKDAHAEIAALARSLGDPLPSDSCAIWSEAIAELATLQPVLIHNGMQEDNFFVRSMDDLSVSGIIDWGFTRVGNPVLDLDFHVWCSGMLWRWWPYLPMIRRAAWRRYLSVRGLSVSNPEILNLYSSLGELMRAMQDSAGRPFSFMNRSFPETIGLLLQRIRASTLEFR